MYVLKLLLSPDKDKEALVFSSACGSFCSLLSVEDIWMSDSISEGAGSASSFAFNRSISASFSANSLAANCSFFSCSFARCSSSAFAAASSRAVISTTVIDKLLLSIPIVLSWVLLGC